MEINDIKQILCLCKACKGNKIIKKARIKKNLNTGPNIETNVLVV